MSAHNFGGRMKSLASRVAALIDDVLPMSPAERERRDKAGLDPNEVAHRRKRRLHIRRFEKTGRGGYR